MALRLDLSAMKSNILTAYLLLTLVIFMNSCVSHPPYPQHWSGLQETQKCPRVEGDYSNTGEAENNSKYRPFLYTYLIGENRTAAERASLIKITQGTNSLLIEAYSDDTLLGRRVADFNPDDCENGFLKLQVPDYKTSGWFGVDWAGIQISKAADSSLILRYNYGGVGFVLVFPVGGSSWNWYRFPNREKH